MCIRICSDDATRQFRWYICEVVTCDDDRGINIPSSSDDERVAFANALRRSLLEDVENWGFSNALRSSTSGTPLYLHSTTFENVVDQYQRMWPDLQKPPETVDHSARRSLLHTRPTIDVRVNDLTMHDEKLRHRLELLPVQYIIHRDGGCEATEANGGCEATEANTNDANDANGGGNRRDYYQVTKAPIRIVVESHERLGHVVMVSSFPTCTDDVTTAPPSQKHVIGCLASHGKVHVDLKWVFGCARIGPGFNTLSTVFYNEALHPDGTTRERYLQIDPAYPISSREYNHPATCEQYKRNVEYAVYKACKALSFRAHSVYQYCRHSTCTANDPTTSRFLEVDIGPNYPIPTNVKKCTLVMMRQFDENNENKHAPSSQAVDDNTIFQEINITHLNRCGNLYAFTYTNGITASPSHDNHAEADHDNHLDASIQDLRALIVPSELDECGSPRIWKASLRRSPPALQSVACSSENEVAWSITLFDESYTFADHFQVYWLLRLKHDTNNPQLHSLASVAYKKPSPMDKHVRMLLTFRTAPPPHTPPHTVTSNNVLPIFTYMCSEYATYLEQQLEPYMRTSFNETVTADDLHTSLMVSSNDTAEDVTRMLCPPSNLIL